MATPLARQTTHRAVPRCPFESVADPSGGTLSLALERQLHQLYLDLFAVIERDPEQEILGIALPVIDTVLSTARDRLAQLADPVTEAMVDLISPTTVRDGVPVRALDTWLVVGQLIATLSLPFERRY